MYGIFTYIWVIYGANVAKYTIHGSSGFIYSWYNTLEGLNLTRYQVYEARMIG